MKKLLSALIVALLFLSCAASAAVKDRDTATDSNGSDVPSQTYSGEIRFRDLEWGIPFPDAIRALVGDNYYIIFDDDTGIDLKSTAESSLSADVSLLIYPANNEYQTAIFYKEPLSVAGYNVSQVVLDSVWKCDDNSYSTDINESLFCYAYYVLYTTGKDPDAIIDDLSLKLSFLYGDPVVFEDRTAWVDDNLNAISMSKSDSDIKIMYVNTEIYKTTDKIAEMTGSEPALNTDGL